MFSFTPLRNPIGFGAVDYIELFLALLLVSLALLGRPVLVPLAQRLSRKPVRCLMLLAVLPVALRLLLLANHPVPSPDIYDEFGHLLVADTLLHGRLANPPHALPQFFETFFVLQRPTYSSIYPIGNGLAMALGQLLFGTPWAGVLLGSAALCALTFWMLRAWTSPGWALLGGLLAVFQFGPMNQWTNNYWGGAGAATAGCLVFGALPRLRDNAWKPAILCGLGLGLCVLTRPYESVFLLLGVCLYFLPQLRTRQLPLCPLLLAALVALPALGITLLQNKGVTGHWTTLPYQLSMYQYGVPAPLTFQATITPHVPLTREQEFDYRMQRNFQPGPDTLQTYLRRLLFRTRYYRFYFYAPLYLALLAFLFTLRDYRRLWLALTCLLFALGVNFFPAFQFHYLAPALCLFVLITVQGLERISRWPFGPSIASLIVFLCVAQFTFWFGLHFFDNQDFARQVLAFDTWDSLNHTNPQRRIAVRQELAAHPGKLLVFVHYWPGHPFQDEWVYNGADIDSQRIVWARDLGPTENQKLLACYPGRTPLSLEPDARPPALTGYEPAEPSPQPEQVQAPPAQPTPPPKPDSKKPLLQLEQVR